MCPHRVKKESGQEVGYRAEIELDGQIYLVVANIKPIENILQYGMCQHPWCANTHCMPTPMMLCCMVCAITHGVMLTPLTYMVLCHHLYSQPLGS